MQKNKKNPELNTFLTTQLSLLKTLKETKIRFNPKPFSKKQEKTTNFNIDIIKKIDETINQNNTEQMRKLETTTLEEQKINISPEPIVEIREPWTKTPEPPQFIPMINTETPIKPQTDIQPPEAYTNNTTNEKQENINTIFFTGEKIKKTVSTLGHIKIRKKENNTKTKNNNGLAKTKKELEEMEKLAKQKEEEELKKKEEERKKQEKLKKLEEKRKLREEKQKEKERKKLEREKQKELKKLERQKRLEQKLKEKEEQKKKKIEEKQKLLAELEKKKQLEKQKKEKKTETSEKKILPFFKITEKKETKTTEQTTQTSWDEEVSQAITIIDNLLEQLPEETIDKFVQSEDFEIYEKVVKKYKQNKMR